MSEKDFQVKIKDELEGGGYFVYRPHDTITSGVPDVFFSNGSRGMWWELKYTLKDSDRKEITLSHSLSAQQSKFLREVGGQLLIGFSDGKMMIVDTDDIRPGPNKKFKIKDLFEDIQEEIKW